MTHQTSLWTGPVIFTLGVAVSSLFVSVAAVTWQITSWRRSGPRISVAATIGVTGYENLVVKRAKNSGRLATVIQSCGFDLNNSRHIVCPFDFIGRPLDLPAPLMPGGTIKFRFNTRDVATPLSEEQASGDGVQAYVETGHGCVRSKAFHLGKMLETAGAGLQSAASPNELR